MHPRVCHKHVDYRTGEVSLTTSKRGARELVYFTRGRDGRAPFSFQTDYVPVMSVCCERVRVCVMGRASPAMYPLAYCFAGVSPPRNPFSKNKNWTFYSKKGVPEQPSGLRSPHGPFEAPRQQRDPLRTSRIGGRRTSFYTRVYGQTSSHPKPLRSAVRGFWVKVISKDGHGTTSCGDVRRVRADGAVPCGAAGARLPLKNGRDPGRGGLSIILRALTK